MFPMLSGIHFPLLVEVGLSPLVPGLPVGAGFGLDLPLLFPIDFSFS